MIDDRDSRFEGVTVPEPGFADDDGSVDPWLAEVLSAYDSGAASMPELVSVLSDCRLMTPLVAILDEAEESPAGPRQEKSSHLASVSLIEADGRRGLLAFGSVGSMAAWDPAARGIPAPASRVAAAALEEGADAVLLDLAGPVRVAIWGSALRALADGTALPEPHLDPELRAAVVAAVSGLDGLDGMDIEGPGPSPDGRGSDLLVVLVPAPGADVTALAEAVAGLALAHPLVAERCPRGVAVGVRVTES